MLIKKLYRLSVAMAVAILFFTMQGCFAMEHAKSFDVLGVSSIKTPFACLENHPNSQEMSCYIRQCWQVPLTNNYDGNSKNVRVLEKCADFCYRYHYRASDKVLQNMRDMLSDPSAANKLRQIMRKEIDLIRGNSSDTVVDTLELSLFYFRWHCNLEDDLIKELFLKTADHMIKKYDRKEISLFYLNSSCDYLMQHNKDKDAQPYCQLGADYDDPKAQFNLGIIFECVGDIKQAQEYFKMAAAQGYKDANTLFLEQN